MIKKLRLAIRNDLEAPEETRYFGSGWLSGVAALILGIASLCLLLGERLQGVFSTQMLSPLYALPQFTLMVQALLLASFLLACSNLVLRRNRVLGFTAILLVLLTITIAETIDAQAARNSDIALSLDWFVLNILLTGFLFIPLEKLFGRLTQQPLFRDEWREDLFYFLISSVFVQTLTLFTLAPSMTILHYTGDWASMRQAIASQPLWLQVIEIMFLTDFVQYWFHRAFHQIPFLWGFHAVHHSAKKMDWLAGSRMHIVEIIGLRSMTVVPMYVLGFAEGALHLYILLVYLNATFVHANVRFNVEWLKPLIVTPRFHHWHHGIEKEAIDVNFSIHFPLFDKLFGTYYMPKNQWPSGYGIGGHPVPNGYWKQLMYPFKK
ncbi:sterol desaturase family protein [Methylophilus sp. 14]|uniref:sterol desaturase family protein n=1 Tax=Methylophilus sp. 14 TaxID=2781019 RepID=UPI00188FDC86|nr:sterol desaturase family protein [Methylophilus sp. 14]MBF4988867.1 sterol desaturase family protein [Methylophilus sp. 14]